MLEKFLFSLLFLDIIESAVDAITIASAGAADVLLALGHLNPKAAIFMKILIQIGGIIATEINPKVNKHFIKFEYFNLKIFEF